jgi:hypothetical protein
MAKGFAVTVAHRAFTRSRIKLLCIVVSSFLSLFVCRLEELRDEARELVKKSDFYSFNFERPAINELQHRRSESRLTFVEIICPCCRSHNTLIINPDRAISHILQYFLNLDRICPRVKSTAFCRSTKLTSSMLSAIGVPDSRPLYKDEHTSINTSNRTQTAVSNVIQRYPVAASWILPAEGIWHTPC